MPRFLVAATLLAVSANVGVVRAQVKSAEGVNHPPATKAAQMPLPPRRPPNKAPRLPAPNPVEELKRFQSLPPEQRENELAKLPPARRVRVEKQLERFDAMPAEERERAFHRLELNNSLTFERRGAVQDEIKRLRELRPRFRRDYLYSDEFKQKFSPVEQELVHGAFPKL